MRRAGKDRQRRCEMSQYDRGYYEAMAARNFQDAMDAAADASLALVNRQHAGDYVSMADYMALRKQFNILLKDRDEVVAQRDSSQEAVRVYRAVLGHYVRGDKIVSAEKVKADLRGFAAQMGISWG